MLLAGCAASGDALPDPTAAYIPQLPADVLACRQSPTIIPDRELTAGEVERLWKTDRARLAKVNGCFGRAICQYQYVAAGLAKASQVACEGSGSPKSSSG